MKNAFLNLCSSREVVVVVEKTFGTKRAVPIGYTRPDERGKGGHQGEYPSPNKHQIQYFDIR